MKQARLLLSCTLMTGIALSTAVAREQTAAMAPGLKVILSAPDEGVYPKSRMVLRMTFVNEGSEPVTLDGSAFAPDRFRIIDSKGREPGRIAAEIPPAGALRIDGLETLEHQVDLSVFYPSLTSKPGAWEVAWSHRDLAAGPLAFRIVRAYNQKKDRTAIVDTELGRMIWRLMPEHAPAHVKHFVDLARRGFYDGLTIYKVIPGIVAEGGDPNGDGTGGWDRPLMPEFSETVTMKMGLVGALRRSASVSNNFIFFITLGPNDYMQGKQSFFAEVTSGIEVVAKLFRAPSHGKSGEEKAYMLTPPVKIHRIRVGR